MVPVSTTVGVSIATTLLFSMVTLVVGVVIGMLCSRRGLSSKSSVRSQASCSPPPSSVEHGVSTAPEYEEISLQQTKPQHIHLTTNEAYACKQDLQ